MNIEGDLISIIPVKPIFLLDFIDFNNLFYLNFSSFRFTWCNNQSRFVHHSARLDSCLVNLAWISSFQSYSLTYLPCVFSNHALLLFSVSTLVLHHRINFCLEDFCVDYLGCHNVVRDAWNFCPTGTPCMRFLIFFVAPEPRLALARLLV